MVIATLCSKAAALEEEGTRRHNRVGAENLSVPAGWVVVQQFQSTMARTKEQRDLRCLDRSSRQLFFDSAP